MGRWLLIAVLAAACSKASNEGDKKQWQESPPPKDINVPAGLAISVEVDGAARPQITSDTLAKIKPDFVDADHRAWRIPTLVVEAAPPGSIIEAGSSTGVAVKFEHPTTEGLEPVLFLTRRGEVLVTAVDPKDPFPRYHGQGSRLRRPGDSMPRVGQVTKLSIIHPAPKAPNAP
jgi:hypothetical protein